MIVRTTPDENGTQWETAEVTLLTVDATRIPLSNDGVTGAALDVDAVAEEVVQAAYRKAHDLIHDHTGLEYFGDAMPGEVRDMEELAGMIVRSVLVNGPKVGDDVAAVWSATGRNLLDSPGHDEDAIDSPHGVVANVIWEDGGDNTEWFAQILNEAKGHWDGNTFWADEPFNLSEDEDPPLYFQYGFFGGITVHAPEAHSDSELERLLWRSPYIAEGWAIDSFDAAVPHPRSEVPNADTVDLGPPREILVHLNVRAPEDTNAETLASEIMGAIEVGTDADMTPDLIRSHVEVALAEEI